MAQTNGKTKQLVQDKTSSYISALKHLSSKSRTDAEKNRMIEKLRECTDMELQKIGVSRAGIERLVYGGELV